MKKSLIFIVIWFVCFFWLIYLIFWWEQEGVVNNISNCNQVITINDAFYNRIFRNFICEYGKTGDKLIWGTCYHAIFDANWNCTKLITYEKTSDINCPAWQQPDGRDWNCICTEDSQYIMNGSCYNKCWAHSSYNWYDGKCYCDNGYGVNAYNQCVEGSPGDQME